MLVRTTASFDGRPLAVDRANVVGLARYLGELGAFRDVYTPEILDAGLESAARLELEERYASAPIRGHRTEIRASAQLRIELPGAARLLELEARASGSAGRGGQAREELIARLQRQNLDDLGEQLRAEPLLFAPVAAPPRGAAAAWTWGRRRTESTQPFARLQASSAQRLTMAP